MATKTEIKLVSVRCIEPIRCNGKKYAPGSTLAGLTALQANALVAGNHAELVPDTVDELPVLDGGLGGEAAKTAAKK